ncbi:MAG TPA: hypothetical protein VF820_05815, partial [Patescibacteria group bacterium]
VNLMVQWEHKLGMENNDYTVLITASGKGSKLGELTKFINKTLVRVGRKPAISYIIERYPKNTNFVITLGHFGDQVKDFLEIAYPQNKFTFVNVDRYEGKGSSLGYSLLKAAPYLQKPFIYHASDTIVYERIAKPTSNWIGGFNGIGSSNYTSFNVLNNRIQKILNKGIIDPDYLHIGLVGISDYEKFWKFLEELHNSNIYKDELADFHVLNEMIANGAEFKIREYKKWDDVGNLDALQRARQNINEPFQILEKPKESIYFINNNVIKFFSNEENVQQRVKRAKILKGLVPSVKKVTKNYYMYGYVKGELYADIANESNFSKLLKWAFDNLWKPSNEVSNNQFKMICYNFYYQKTKKRINEFLKTRSLIDQETIINGEKTPSLENLLSLVDFDMLSDGIQTNFHGDFILDNIIKTKNEFILLDWRQNFGGLLKSGDIYYDLAKLNHNLIINHNIINNNLFSIKLSKKNVTYEILRKDNLIHCQKVLFDFIEKKGLNLKKVKLLTAISWLNMSPLHLHPYDSFLFFFGKRELWRVINEKENKS